MFSSPFLASYAILFSCINADTQRGNLLSGTSFAEVFSQPLAADTSQRSPTSSLNLFSNTSSTASTSSFTYETPSVCCFVIQETATENYWPIESKHEIVQSFNIVDITSYVTPYKNGTVVSVETKIIPTTTVINIIADVGVNPISFYDNPVPPLPGQLSTEEPLSVTAVVTGGVTVNSPSAFLVYSTLKIITVAPVTNADGFVQCGTRSSWDSPGPMFMEAPTWPNINSNAEAYFGGYGLAGDKQVPTKTSTILVATTNDDGEPYTIMSEIYQNTTYYTNSAGETVPPVPVGTGVAAEITLIEPFVFFPTQGFNGATLTTTCFQADETELYGYVPQTLVDEMAQDRGYLAQYPGLTSCLPGGPSIIRRDGCTSTINSSLVYQTPEPGDLSRTTVITVTPPPYGDDLGGATDAASGVTLAGGGIQSVPKSSGPAHFNTPADPSDPSFTRQPVSTPIATPIPSPGPIGGDGGETTVSLPAADFNSLADPSDPPFSRQGGAVQPPPQTSIGAIIISILGGDSGGGGNNIGGSLSESIISGTPVFVIPNPTTVAAAGLPAGLGSTTIINGTPFVVIQPTTIPIPGGVPAFSTTFVNGIPFLVIPGPLTIPVADAPSGLVGSTTLINGTPFLVIPSPTSIPALPGQLTVIGGTTFDVFSGATTVPVDPELSLVGITTVISGTTMVVLPGATTVPVDPTSPAVVQASGARRSRVSWIGFGLELVTGFVLRFR